MHTDFIKFFRKPKAAVEFMEFLSLGLFKGVVMIILRLFLYLKNPVRQREVYNF